MGQPARPEPLVLERARLREERFELSRRPRRWTPWEPARPVGPALESLVPVARLSAGRSALLARAVVRSSAVASARAMMVERAQPDARVEQMEMTERLWRATRPRSSASSARRVPASQA